MMHGTLGLLDANVDGEFFGRFIKYFRRHQQEEPPQFNPIMQRAAPHMRIHLKDIPPFVRISTVDS